MEGILVSTKNPSMKVVDVENKLEAFYELLGCDVIDIVERKIANMVVTIVCDDEGIIAQKMPTGLSRPKITLSNGGGSVSADGILQTKEGNFATEISYTPALFGDILIVGGTDSDGNLYGLSDDQIEFLMKQGVKLVNVFEKKHYEAIANVEFV